MNTKRPISVIELPPLAVGDLVELRSGSPPLTVVAIDSDVITITWFDGPSQYTQELPRACLRRHDGPRAVA